MERRIGDRYVLETLLGKGGMGEVWRGRHVALKSPVAIKLLHGASAANETTRTRFLQEAQVTAQLRTRHAVQVFDFGVTEEGQPYLVMELIDGESLAARLDREGRLAGEAAVRLLRQAARALEKAHALGIVHRDLKPDNILIARDDEGNDEAKVVDFGIAKLVGDLDQAPEQELDLAKAPTSFTKTGALLGTPSYMAPEQVQGARDLGPRADTWALGVVAFECLTGQQPFRGASLHQLFMAIVAGMRPLARSIDPALPPELDEWLAIACAVDPARRFASPVEAIDALAIALRVQAPPPPPSQPRAVEVVVHRSVRPDSATVQVGTLEKNWDLGPPAVAPARRRRWPWLVAGAIGVAALSFAIPAVLRAPAPRAEASVAVKSSAAADAAIAPLTILVCDFENRSGEPLLDGTLEPAVAAALEDASFITAYSRSSARKAAAKIDPGAKRIDEALGREVAQREGVGVVVSGVIDADPAGFRVTLRAVDAATGATRAAPPARVADKRTVLDAAGKLAAQVRAGLGDKRPTPAEEAMPGTFSTDSVEAAHEYGIGVQLNYGGDFEGSIAHHRRAVEIDPRFGTAYAALAANYANLGMHAEAEKYFALALSNIDKMTDREKRRMRSVYYLVMHDDVKAIEELSSYVRDYPGDAAAQANLALAYGAHHDMGRALDEARRGVELDPKRVVSRGNLAGYALYAGDVETCERVDRALLDESPGFWQGHATLGMALLLTGDHEGALREYRALEGSGPHGASLGPVANADLALFEGRAADALPMLEQGLAVDLAAKDASGAARKHAMLAEAHLARGHVAAALASAARASAVDELEPMLLAARVEVDARDDAKALAIAARLAGRREPDARAYAKVIEAEVKLARGDARAAIALLRGAIAIEDAWLAHLDLARAHLDAGELVDADAELGVCVKRRGEAAALFLDEVPTLRVLPAVYFLRGRVLDGLHSEGAPAAYREFLAMRSAADPRHDAMVDQAKKRLN